MFADYSSMKYYFDEGKVLESTLPPNLEPPKTGSRNYLSTNHGIPGDFLMLTEGSEVEGPIPRITIPKEGNGSFDVDHFAICLMSTDMQTQNGQLNFCLGGDAQLLISKNDHGVFAFVQHFTLHDSMARGFVRPFCLAYLSSDRNKLVHFYDRLSSEFARVVSYLKMGNFLVFFRDMSHILSDLQFTKERIKEATELGIFSSSSSCDFISKLIANSQAMTMQQKSEVMASAAMQQQAARTAADTSLTATIPDVTLDGVSSSTDPSLNYEEAAENCLVSNASELSVSNGDGGGESVTGKVGRSSSPKSDPTSAVPSPSRSVGDLRSRLTEIDSAIAEVRIILTMVSNLLEQHQVEVKEQFSPKPSPAPRETPLDSENFDIARQLETPSKRSHYIKDNKYFEPSWIRWTDSEECYQPQMRTSLRTKIQKNLRSFEGLTHLTPDVHDLFCSIYRYFNRGQLTLAMEMDDIKDLDPPQGLLTIGRIVYFNFLDKFDKSGETSNTSTTTPVDEHIGAVSSPVDRLVREWISNDTLVSFHTCPSKMSYSTTCNDVINDVENKEDINFSEGQNGSVTECHETSKNSSARNLDFNSAVRNVERFCSRPTCLDIRPDSGNLTVVGDDENDLSNSKRRPLESRASVVCIADHVNNFTLAKRIGFGISNIFRLYPSFAADLVYTLLVGRTLIIYSTTPSSEADIKQMVTALWMFVPGYFRVLPWTTVALTTRDMTRLRLVGLLRREENIVPYNYQTSASFFDFNKKKFVGTPYKSGMLLEAVEKRMSYQDDSSYVAYWHSILFDLARKSFIYFHHICMNESLMMSNDQASRSGIWNKGVGAHIRSVIFCRERLKLSEHDASVVINLASIVREQLRKGNRLSGDDNANGISIKLEHRPHW